MATQHGELTTVSFGGTAIPQVTSIDGPSLSQAGIETNYMQCGTITQRPSNKTELGTVTVSFVYSSAEAGHTALPTALTAGTEAALVVTYTNTETTPDAEVWTADAFVSNFELSAEDDADVTGEVEFQLTSAPLIT